MIGAAGRRALLPLLLVAFAVVVVAAVAILAGSSFQRAIALGLYAAGSFLTTIGFALGSRSLFRPAEKPPPSPTGRPLSLWETKEADAVLLVAGLLVLAAGIAVDPRVRLI